MYNLLRSRQLEGTYSQGPEVGVSIVTSMRIMRGWGSPPESAKPYSVEHWPPLEPPGMDTLARQSRVLAYQRVRDMLECKLAIASGHLVYAAFDCTDQWFWEIEGVREVPQSAPARVSMMMLGYNDHTGLFTIQNSWAADRGDRSLGYLSYDFFGKYFLECWATKGLCRDGGSSDQDGLVEMRWSTEDILGGSLHAVELYDSGEDECIGWAFTVCRDGFLDIEQLFVRPAFRGNNNGNRLTGMLRELAARIGLPLRLWVAHADLDQPNLAIVEKMAKRLSLKLGPSDVQWAGLKAVT
jgi:GNAT superfamily N-acetyltransferase